ncbi:MAG: hypothetical protein IT377_04200 [Polyangiaceae bacterium]|nr:hypothetical protein [Polyangiaceae bacterium]
MASVLSWPVYWVVAYFTMIETQTTLVVQAQGYDVATVDCTLLWCSWTARNTATGVLESGRALCSPLLDCEITSRPTAP